jgi:Ca-activated chloride channel family protein
MPATKRSWIPAMLAASIPVCLSLGAATCNAIIGATVKPAVQAATMTPQVPTPMSSAVQHPSIIPTNTNTNTNTNTSTTATTDELIRFESSLDRGAVMAGGNGLVRMELRIASEHEPEAGARRATDLVVVLDESGSMSGAKIEDARAAAQSLLSQLGSEDRFALVSFDSDVSLPIPLDWANAENRRGMQRAIRGIHAGGGTGMQAGLAAGAEQHDATPGRAARTILISDGLPDSPHGLVSQALGFAQAETPLTTVGIGEDYDEQLMVELADAGTGNFYWVHQGQDLAAVFGHELSTAQETVATGLQVGLELGEGVELVDASGYPTRMVGGQVVFDVGTLYAQQQRSFWITLRVPADQPGDQAVAMPSLSWRSPESAAVASLVLAPQSVEVVRDQHRFLASVDGEAWGRSIIEEEYNVLRQEVSRAVQEGDLATAQASIDAYTARNRALNEQVDNQAVWDNFEEVAQLEQQVQRQFEGEQQQARQNVFAKTLSSMGYGSRRTGQAKGY